MDIIDSLKLGLDGLYNPNEIVEIAWKKLAKNNSY